MSNRKRAFLMFGSFTLAMVIIGSPIGLLLGVLSIVYIFFRVRN